MAAKDVWLWQAGRQWTLPVEKVIGLLANENIRAEAVNKQDATGPGVVLFERVTQEFCNSIRELSDGGFEHVLGVVARDSDLRGEDTWNLLDAGVLDVIAWDQDSNPARMVAARVEHWMSIE